MILRPCLYCACPFEQLNTLIHCILAMLPCLEQNLYGSTCPALYCGCCLELHEHFSTTRTQRPTRLLMVQVKEDQFDRVKEALLSACAASSQSSLPSIYGQAASVKAKLRPLSSGGIQVLPALTGHRPP